MTIRHNTCVNPALGVDAAGWGGGSIPVRTAVSGFDRPYAARYTSGTFTSGPRGAVVAGGQYTLSQYVYVDNGAATINGGLYIEWRNAATNVVGYTNGNYSVPGQTVTRISISGTAPANATTAQIITDGYNHANGSADYSMVLVEAGATPDTYFDGDSPNGSWDGTPGASASTFDDTEPEPTLGGQMALHAAAILDRVISHAMAVGLFERVNGHEPANAPGHGLTAAVWVDSVGPAQGASGLASTSARVVVNVRLYGSADADPRDAIDPSMLDAVGQLMGAYSGDFQFGGDVRNVDLLGQSGQPLSAQAGYLQQDGKVFRVMTLVVPVIVSDVWEQVP